MADRVSRRSPAAEVSETVNVGRIKCFSEAAPNDGSHPSFKENTISSISPSQNPGIDAKTSATTTHTWSVMEYWRTAERIPSEIPIMEETHMESSARINVFGNLARISLITGWREA